MNIFYVANIDLQDEGATTRHVFEVCDNLIELGHQVTLFVPARGLYQHHTPVKIVRIPILPIPALFPLVFQLGLFCYLAVFFLRHKPDIVYTRSTHIGVAQTGIKILFRIPLVTEINGNKLEEARMKGASAFKVRLIAFFEKSLCRLSDKLICVTPGLQSWLIDAYHVLPDKITVISNGANVDISRPMDQRSCREMLELEQDVLYVCFVGTLHVWQGLEYLIKAAPLVIKDVPEARFIVVGDGDAKPGLLKEVSERNLDAYFDFAGRVSYNQVPLYINASDVCVAPFVREKVDSAPLKIFEYMACGKPVVTSSKAIAQTRAGIMIEAENSLDLAETLVCLLKDRDLRARMGKRARELAVSEFSWKRVAKKVGDVCDAAMSVEKYR